MIDLPDPTLTAILTCAERLDDAIGRVLAPFWREFRIHDPECQSLLWFHRYGRCGEHLKIRWHGPEAQRSLAQRLLRETADAFFSQLDLPEPSTTLRRRRTPPPIDIEDRATAEYPDRTLLFTEYQRSPVFWGESPQVEDDRYVALLTSCLARGCELLLAECEPADEKTFPERRRQQVLLKILSAGLDALWVRPQERRAYLTYHRDWAVRYLSLESVSGVVKARKILERYETSRETLGPDFQESLRRLPADCRKAAEAESGNTGRLRSWRRALCEFRDYLEPLNDRDDYQLDPFAEGPLYPTLLKVFHGMANQVGLNALNEGLTHHLLLRSIDEAEDDRFSLLPEEVDATLAEPPRPAPEPQTDSAEDAPEPIWFNFEQDYRWIELVALSSEEGRLFRERYRLLGHPISKDFGEALRHLRQGSVEEGKLLLDNIENRRRSLREEHPSIYHVLGRFYYGSLAFYFYALGDFQGVDRAMEEAHASIAAAVGGEPSLLAFAALSTDIPLKRIRIAHDRRRWREMREQIEFLHQIMTNRRPLCQVDEQKSIFIATLGDFFSSLPSLDPAHQAALAYLTDESVRLHKLRLSIARLYMPRGLFIQYP